ncbi:uncharacterized protein METZ01_LOCUS421693, partial [marine metagenome]
MTAKLFGVDLRKRLEAARLSNFLCRMCNQDATPLNHRVKQ